MSRRWFDIDAIQFIGRMRHVNEDKARELAESILELGLMTPPAVRILNNVVIEGEDCDSVPVLIAGRHRVRAFEILGRTAIECDVYDVDDNHAKLMEIDENLRRAELGEAAECGHIKVRRDTVEDIKLERAKREAEESGKTFSTLPKTGRGNKQFSTETADLTGKSRQSINQKLARADALGDDIWMLDGTSLDKGVEIEALIDLKKADESAYQELVARAAAGEKVSARPAQPSRPPATTAADALTKIMSGIAPRLEREHDNSQEVRREAREAIDVFGAQNMPFLISLLEGSPKKLAAEIRRLL